MARVLISTFGSSGDLNPYLAIAQVLKNRGHDPTLATLDAHSPETILSR
jgi:rhamnosyltransferase subunit B